MDSMSHTKAISLAASLSASHFECWRHVTQHMLHQCWPHRRPWHGGSGPPVGQQTEVTALKSCTYSAVVQCNGRFSRSASSRQAVHWRLAGLLKSCKVSIWDIKQRPKGPIVNACSWLVARPGGNNDSLHSLQEELRCFTAKQPTNDDKRQCKI